MKTTFGFLTFNGCYFQQADMCFCFPSLNNFISADYSWYYLHLVQRLCPAGKLVIELFLRNSCQYQLTWPVIYELSLFKFQVDC